MLLLGVSAAVGQGVDVVGEYSCVDVDDGNPCTIDSCDPLTGPVHVPVDAGISCSDGNVCNGEELCDGAGYCRPGTPLAVDDGNPCTIDSCDPVVGVSHMPAVAGTSCNDGSPCTYADACNGAGACAGTPITCASDACNQRSCNGTATCAVAVLVGSTCDDGNACTYGDACDATGACKGTALTCQSEPCAQRSCNGTAACTVTPVAGCGTGDGAEYTYDGAGNILQMRAAGTAVLTIIDFSPREAGLGQAVTVYGTGFDSTPSRNRVAVNGVSASVLSATANELSFAIPAGAATGAITVTVGTATATSANALTVVSNVVVTGFSPVVGKAGTLVTIRGFNFDAIPAGDSVSIGGGSASVTSASETALVASIGTGCRSGRITVTTPLGSGTSADTFFIVPGSYLAGDVASATATSIGAAPATVSLPNPGDVGLVVFDGVQGQLLTVYVSGNTITGSTQLKVYGPDGVQFSSTSLGSRASAKYALAALPATGPYTIVVQPEAGNIGTLDLQVLPEATGMFTLGTAAPVTLARGQNGRYTFAANAGATLGIGLSAVGTDPAGATVYLWVDAPDGSNVYYGYFTGPTSWQLPRLTSTGTFTVRVQPAGVAALNATLVVAGPVTGTIAVDGSATSFASVIAGQAGRFTFTGNAGDWLGLGVTALTTTPTNGSVSFMVYKPDGTTLGSGLSTATPTSQQLAQLPVSGIYTLVIVPSGSATATASLLLSRALVGTLPPDGPATTYLTARVGQPGRYTFTGSTGQRFTMQATLGPNFSRYGVTLTVYKPSGAALASSQFSAGTDLKIDLGALPESGTYTAVLVPSGVNTGSVTMRLVGVATDTLVTGDPPKAFSLLAAQDGRYTFTGNAGDWLGLGISALATTPANGNVWFAVYKPDGTSLGSFNAVNPSSWQLPQLPVSGTYTLAVQPPGTVSASFTLLLSSAITGTIATDGTATQYATTRVGQPGRYTFSGSTGQRFTMQGTLGPNFSKYDVTLNVCQPGGTSIAWSQFSSGTDLKIDLGALAANGTYTVIIVPGGAKTGSVDMRLIAYASGTLVIGDPPKSLGLGAAQSGRYTFAGTAGDLVNLAASNVTTSPTNAYVWFYVYKPDGSSLWSSYVLSPQTTTWQLPQLPVGGTYTLAVQPQGTVGTNLTVQLPRR